MTVKTLSDEQLAELGRLASLQFRTAYQSWELAMKCFRVDSRQYRAIRAAGKAADRNYCSLRNCAEDRCWSRERMDEIFTMHIGVGWG